MIEQNLFVLFKFTKFAVITIQLIHKMIYPVVYKLK